MKKTCILILIVVLSMLTISFIMKGFSIGDKPIILGIGQIKNKNQQIEKQIEIASKMVKSDFDKAKKEVDEANKNLIKQKEKYEEIAMLESDKEDEKINQIDKYELETLWVRLGNHATAQGVEMKIDITTSTGGTGDLYNLRFTAIGSYISISDFIYAIENDSTLGFKIEEFKLTSNDGEVLVATFVCKDIAIKDVMENAPGPMNDSEGGPQDPSIAPKTNENVPDKEKADTTNEKSN